MLNFLSSFRATRFSGDRFGGDAADWTFAQLPS